MDYKELDNKEANRRKEDINEELIETQIHFINDVMSLRDDFNTHMESSNKMISDCVALVNSAVLQCAASMKIANIALIVSFVSFAISLILLFINIAK